LVRRANLGAAKSCSLVIIFMIRPPTASSESDYANRSRPSRGSRCVELGNRDEGQQASREIYELPEGGEKGCQCP
jgi:hypothetical protein